MPIVKYSQEGFGVNFPWTVSRASFSQSHQLCARSTKPGTNHPSKFCIVPGERCTRIEMTLVMNGEGSSQIHRFILFFRWVPPSSLHASVFKAPRQTPLHCRVKCVRVRKVSHRSTAAASRRRPRSAPCPETVGEKVAAVLAADEDGGGHGSPCMNGERAKKSEGSKQQGGGRRKRRRAVGARGSGARARARGCGGSTLNRSSGHESERRGGQA